MARGLLLVRWVCITGFLALLTLPLLGALGGGTELGNEKRLRTPRPALTWSNWSAYPEAFNGYWRDAFGFRDDLIHWHSLLKVKWLRESPVPNVIIGSHGRLFFADWDGAVNIDDFSGKRPATPAELDSILQNLLRRRAEYAALGASVLVVIAPNKQTIYPESVPDRYGPPAPGVLDKVLAYLSAHSDLDVLDLRPPLRAHLDQPLYFKTDTHWNAIGAFHGAQAIIERERSRFPALEPLRDSDFTVTSQPKVDGDLATMLSMRGSFEDIDFIYHRRGGERARLLVPETEVVDRTYEQVPPSNGLRVLMFGDSFGVWLARPLAQSVGHLRSYYSARAGYDATLPKVEKPNLVILEVVERFILNLATD